MSQRFATNLDDAKIYHYIAFAMTGLSKFKIIFLAILMACSSAQKEQGGDINFEYELMKMEQIGKVDSVIMANALAGSDNKIIEKAVRACGIIRDANFTDRLVELCLHQDKAIREKAIFALGEIKDTTTIHSLAAVLQGDDIDGRILTLEAFGKIGQRNYAPFIKPFLKKSDNEAYEAALALWRMGDSTSLEDLKWLADNGSGKALYGAIYAMFKLMPDSCAGAFSRVFEKLSAENSFTDETLSIAARGLGFANDTAAVLEVYKQYFTDLSRSAKIELIRSMGRVKAGQKKLEELLQKTEDKGLMRAVLLSLGQIGSSGSRKVVEKFLNNSSLQVRLAAISVLPEINKKSPTNSLKKHKFDKQWQIRAEAARSLGKVKSTRSLKQLKLMLEDKDNRVKAAVIEGLAESPIRKNMDIIKAALNGSDDTVVRSVAADVLGSSKNKKAFKILSEAAAKNIDTSDIDFARSLIGAIGYFVDSTDTGLEAVKLIEMFLNHPSRIIRQDAFLALGTYAPEGFDLGIHSVEFEKEDFGELVGLMEIGIIAAIETSRGTIKVKLEPGIAPRTIMNFVKLTERKFYDGLIFHRVVQDFVIQGGCPRGDGWGGPGFMIREEINPIRFERGTIGMATSGRDTGGSQFFICLSDQPHLDGRYTAFGKVIDGWEVLDKIEIGDSILSVKVEKGRF